MAEYSFRPVAADDLPMLQGWLSQIQVARWWPDAADQISHIRDHMTDPGITPLLACLGDDPIGYVQHYPAHRWPAPQFRHLSAEAVALDLFSGPKGFGHGGAWLRQLGDRLLQDAPMLVIDPTPDNTRAVRAYKRAGFEGDVIRPDSEGKNVLVMLRRR